MKVLIATSDVGMRRRFAQWLSAASHVAIEADNATSVYNKVDRQPDVIIVDWAIPGGGAAVVKYLRTLDAQFRHYVVVTSARPQPWEITAFFAAGADDFFAGTACKEELLARIEGRTRMRSWVTSLSRSKSIDLSPVFALDSLRVWRELDTIVAGEIGEMLGTSLSQAEASTAPICWTATVPLSLAVERVEMRFGVGIDESSLDRFVADVLGGDTSKEAIEDAFRELANVAGGALKRAAMTDGVAVTIGLPNTYNLFTAPAARTWSLVGSSGLRLSFAAQATPCQLRSVRRGELREGMVLASDLRNSAGMLLVSAGTYLTSTTVDRLARFLEADARIEVSDVAALPRAS